MAFDTFAKKALHIILAVVSVVTEEGSDLVGPITMTKKEISTAAEDQAPIMSSTS
jgi:hypothetical protein